MMEKAAESKTRNNPGKILFVSEAVTLAHVARLVVLASSLAKSRAYEPVLAVDPRYMGLFESTGVRQREIYSLPTSRFIDALAKGRPLYDLATLEAYLEEDLAVIDEEKPDLIIGDFRLSLSVSARLCKVPYLAVSNAYWSPFSRQRYPIPEHPLISITGVKVAQMLFDIVRPVVFALHTVPMNRLRRRHGLDFLGADLRSVYTDSDYLLYADIPGLVQMNRLPAEHLFIGPVFWSPSQNYPDWWDEVVNAGKPIVYVNLGSSGRGDLLPGIADALSDINVSLVVATAGHSVVFPSRSDVYIADFLPGEQMAARSNLVICNGGSMTTYQALAHGVPVLGIAGNLDQHLNMSAIARLGGGIRMRTDRAEPLEIRASALSLLEDARYKKRAEDIQRQIGSISAETEFRKITDKVLNRSVSG
ncbi:MAG: glycosyltransferase [Gammaproteobacteria bacterium]|nr:glycosyltransferase [Gammaproteobacteria bacterium]